MSQTSYEPREPPSGFAQRGAEVAKCQGPCSWERMALAGAKGPASSGKHGLEKCRVEPHVWFALGGADVKKHSRPALLALSPAGYTYVCPSDLRGNPSENRSGSQAALYASLQGSLLCLSRILWLSND